jgi:RNA polymerase sigma factor (sigma-70 family)
VWRRIAEPFSGSAGVYRAAVDASPTPPELAAALEHERFVRAVAARVLGGDSAVDDVVQETWMRALLAPPQRMGALRAWLATVARNLAIGQRRANSRRARHESAAAGSLARTTSPSVAEIAAQEDERRRLVEAILALEEPYRTTLLVRYREDRTPKDVASLLGVPVETVHTRVRRGLAMLRTRLDREHGGDRRAWAVALAPWAAGAAPAGIAASIVGGIVMGKAMAIGAAAAVIVGVGILAWPRGEEPTGPAVVETAGAAAAPMTNTADSTPALAARPATTAPAIVSAPLAAVPPSGKLPRGGIVVGPDGAPVAGARLTLYLRGVYVDDEGHGTGSPSRRRRRADPLATGESGRDGRVIFAYAGESDFQTHARMMFGSFGGDLDVAAPEFARTVVPIPNVCADDLHVTLARGGLVSLTVVRPDGQPVPGTIVYGRRPPKDPRVLANWLDSSKPELELVADAGGRIEQRLETGTWHLRALAAGLRPVDAPALDVVENGKHVLRIVLDEGIVILAHVVDSQGKPAEGVRVFAGGTMNSVASATTDADGRCRIAGIAPPPAKLAQQDEYWGRQLFYRAIRQDGLAAEGSVGNLPEPGSMPLEIAFAGVTPVRVRVVDDEGVPVPGAAASLYFGVGGSANPIEPNSISATAGPDGVLALPPLGPCVRRLTVSGPEAQPFGMNVIELIVNREPVELDVAIVRQAGRIEGRVLDPSGGIPTKLVVRVGKRGSTFAEAGGVGKVSEDGRFVVENAPRGALELFASADGFAAQRHPIESAASPIELRLRDRGAVAGVVVLRDGSALAGAQLMFGRESKRGATRQGYTAAIATTDGDGRFRVVLDDEEADVTLAGGAFLIAPDGRRTVKPGDETLRIVAKPASEGWGYPIVARITAAGGPFEGEPQLMFSMSDGGAAQGMTTRISEGVYRFGVFRRSEGPLQGAEIRVVGFRPFRLPTIDLRDGAASGDPIEVRLDRGATIRLRVRDGGGKPVAGRWLEIVGQRLKPDAQGELDVSGFEANAAVVASVHAIDDSQYTWEEVRADRAPATVDLVLRRRGVVNVRLPLAWSERQGELVFTLKRSDGSTASEERVPAGRWANSKNAVYSAVAVYESGDFRLEARCDNGSWSAPVHAEVGQTVEIALTP